MREGEVKLARIGFHGAVRIGGCVGRPGRAAPRRERLGGDQLTLRGGVFLGAFALRLRCCWPRLWCGGGAGLPKEAGFPRGKWFRRQTHTGFWAVCVGRAGLA